MDKLQGIEKAIGKLEGITEIGFKNVNNRLDKLNGKILKHDKDIDVIQEKQSISEGKVAGMILIISTLLVIISLVISYFKF